MGRGRRGGGWWPGGPGRGGRADTEHQARAQGGHLAASTWRAGLLKRWPAPGRTRRGQTPEMSPEERERKLKKSRGDSKKAPEVDIDGRSASSRAAAASISRIAGPKSGRHAERGVGDQQVQGQSQALARQNREEREKPGRQLVTSLSYQKYADECCRTSSTFIGVLQLSPASKFSRYSSRTETHQRSNACFVTV